MKTQQLSQISHLGVSFYAISLSLCFRSIIRGVFHFRLQAATVCKSTSGWKKASCKSTAAATDAGMQTPIQPQTQNIVRKAEAAAREQAHNHEWPTLGAARGRASASRSNIPTAINSKADLAALHATLLNEKRIQAADIAADVARSDDRGRGTRGICIGDRVEARFGGGSQWFPATVAKVKLLVAKSCS